MNGDVEFAILTNRNEYRFYTGINDKNQLDEQPFIKFCLEDIDNGKSAIEWIVDRYPIKTDKKSGITNNPNDWSKSVGKPRYILNLLLSVINLLIRTLHLLEELPMVEFES